MSEYRFFPSIGGFRIQSETLEIKLTVPEAKELIADVLRFMEGTTPGEITSESREWLVNGESW